MAMILCVVLILLYPLSTQSEDPDARLVWTIENVMPGNHFLVYLTGDPLEIDTDNVKVSGLRGNPFKIEHPFSLMSDYTRSKIYYYRADERTIYGSDFETTLNFEPVFIGVGDSFSMAIDWRTGNMYWVDGFFNWIAFKSPLEQDAHDFKVLIDRDIHRPTGIALDPVKGYMFWCEAEVLECVKRASLAGDDPEVIAVDGIYNPRGMTIDINTETLYWVDALKQVVEQCKYDGTDRRILRKLKNHSFVAIDFYQGFVFATEPRDKQIVVIKEGTGIVNKYIPASNTGSPRGVTIYSSKKNPRVSNPCLSKGCDHFCVGDSPSAACMCQDGFKLQLDSKSCAGPSNYGAKLLVFATQTMVGLVNVTTPLVDSNIPHTAIYTGLIVTSIAVDADRRLVYVGDKGRAAIFKVDLDGISDAVLMDAGQVEGLTFDWLSNKLIWTDSLAETIKTFDVVTKKTLTIMSSIGPNAGHIVLDPFTSQVFWISGSPETIKSKSILTNSPVKTLVSSGISPKGLFCDPITHMLYWTDRASINSVYFNGTNQKALVSTAEADNYGILVYKEQYIWSSRSSTVSYLNSGNKVHNTHSTQTQISVNENIIDVKVMDEFTQQQTRGVCFENGGCDHLCIPTANRRRCLCELGFDLQADGKTCQTEIHTGKHIMFIDFISRHLYQVDPTSGRLSVSMNIDDSSPALAVNPENTRVYWSEIRRRTIQSSKLDGSDKKKLIDTGTGFADRITVDPTTGNIFYTVVHQQEGNTGDSYIAAVTPDGRARRTIIHDLITPRAIELHTALGIMFWTDFGDNPAIERANMDGTQRQVIVSTDIKFPNGIALDYEDDVLYWCDGNRDVIERCSYFGANRKIIVNDPTAHLVALLIIDDKLYYTGWNRQGIVVVNKADGSNRRYVVEAPEFGELHDLILVTPNIRNPETSSCSINNGGCSTFCLPTEQGRTCACADGVALQSDGMTCVGSLPITTTTTRPTASHLHVPTVPITTTTTRPTTSHLPIFSTGLTTEVPATAAPQAPVSDTVIIASITAGVVILVAVLIVVVVIVLRKRKRRPVVVDTPRSVCYNRESDYATINDGYLDPTYIDPTLMDPPPYSDSPPGPVNSPIYLIPTPDPPYTSLNMATKERC